MTKTKQRLIGSMWTDSKGRTWEVVEMAWPGVYRCRTTDRNCVIEMQASAIRKAIAAGSHTPGPWTVDAPPVNDFGASMAVMAPGKGDKRLYVAEVFKTDDEIPRMTQDSAGMANAHLIAAAPELLEALESIVRLPQGHTVAESERDLARVCAIARAAIAKAEGGAS